MLGCFLKRSKSLRRIRGDQKHRCFLKRSSSEATIRTSTGLQQTNQQNDGVEGPLNISYRPPTPPRSRLEPRPADRAQEVVQDNNSIDTLEDARLSTYIKVPLVEKSGAFNDRQATLKYNHSPQRSTSKIRFKEPLARARQRRNTWDPIDAALKGGYKEKMIPSPTKRGKGQTIVNSDRMESEQQGPGIVSAGNDDPSEVENSSTDDISTEDQGVFTEIQVPAPVTHNKPSKSILKKRSKSEFQRTSASSAAAFDKVLRRIGVSTPNLKNRRSSFDAVMNEILDEETNQPPRLKAAGVEPDANMPEAGRESEQTESKIIKKKKSLYQQLVRKPSMLFDRIISGHPNEAKHAQSAERDATTVMQSDAADGAADISETDFIYASAGARPTENPLGEHDSASPRKTHKGKALRRTMASVASINTNSSEARSDGDKNGKEMLKREVDRKSWPSSKALSSAINTIRRTGSSILAPNSDTEFPEKGTAPFSANTTPPLPQTMSIEDLGHPLNRAVSAETNSTTLLELRRSMVNDLAMSLNPGCAPCSTFLRALSPDILFLTIPSSLFGLSRDSLLSQAAASLRPYSLLRISSSPFPTGSETLLFVFENPAEAKRALKAIISIEKQKMKLSVVPENAGAVLAEGRLFKIPDTGLLTPREILNGLSAAFPSAHIKLFNFRVGSLREVATGEYLALFMHWDPNTARTGIPSNSGKKGGTKDMRFASVDGKTRSLEIGIENVRCKVCGEKGLCGCYIQVGEVPTRLGPVERMAMRDARREQGEQRLRSEDSF